MIETEQDPVRFLGTEGNGGDSEIMEKQSGNSGEVLGSVSSNTQNNIFELFTELKSPQNGRCQHFSLQRKPFETRLRSTDLTYTLILSATLHLNQCYNSLPYLSRLGHIDLRSEPTMSLLPGKVIKLFFSTRPQNSASEIQFGTGA